MTRASRRAPLPCAPLRERMRRLHAALHPAKRPAPSHSSAGRVLHGASWTHRLPGLPSHGLTGRAHPPTSCAAALGKEDSTYPLQRRLLHGLTTRVVSQCMASHALTCRRTRSPPPGRAAPGCVRAPLLRPSGRCRSGGRSTGSGRSSCSPPHQGAEPQGSGGVAGEREGEEAKGEQGEGQWRVEANEDVTAWHSTRM